MMNEERYQLIRNIRLLDPEEKKSDGCDILFVRKNKKSEIIKIGKNLRVEQSDGMTVVNAHGRMACAPFTDLRCAIPSGAADSREYLDSGLAAAVAGGYGRVVLMPAYKPVHDSKTAVASLVKNGKQCSECRVIPAVPLTKGGEGKNLCAFEELKNAGAGALTIGYEKEEAKSRNLLEGLRACGRLGMLFIASAGMAGLDCQGSVNEGKISRLLKVNGIQKASELLALSQAIALARVEKIPVHFPLVTLKESVEMVRNAKKEGVSFSCGTSPLYFSFTEDELMFSGNNAKVLPPLRREEDRMAVIGGLKDGTIDCICSDHTPCTAAEKKQPVESASFGAVGLETAFAAGITQLVLPGHLSLYRLIRLMAVNPAKLLGVEQTVAVGKPMDLAFIDPEAQMVYSANALRSRSCNTPFMGRALYGRVTGLYLDGLQQIW